jgi:hypothetical protein
MGLYINKFVHDTHGWNLLPLLVFIVSAALY